MIYKAEIQEKERNLKSTFTLMAWTGILVSFTLLPILFQFKIFEDNILRGSELYLELLTFSIIFQMILFLIYLLLSRNELLNFNKVSLFALFAIEAYLIAVTGNNIVEIMNLNLFGYQIIQITEFIKAVLILRIIVSKYLDNVLTSKKEKIYVSQIKVKGEHNG